MSEGRGSARSYYRNRAICRKIYREGTHLPADRMSLADIEALVAKHAYYVHQTVHRLDLADVQLARAAVELSDLVTELILRGEQMALPGL